MNGTITDPSDWPSNFVSLREIDSHLRCPICKELMRGAIMLQCGHNFCSECIRRHLDKEQACPACRVAASTSQMRRNVALDEIANHFGDCRSRLLMTVSGTGAKQGAAVSDTSMDIDDSARQQKRRRISGRMTPRSSQELMDLDTNGYHRSSIKKSVGDDDDDFVISSQESKGSHREGPALRRSGRTSATSTTGSDPTPQSAPSPVKSHTFSSSSETIVVATPPTPTTPTRRLPKHTLVACPVCECAIPEAQTNSHLDKFCFVGKKDPIYTLSYALLMGPLTEARAIELYERVGYQASTTTEAALPSKAGPPTLSPTRTQTAVNPFGQLPARSQNHAGSSSLFGGSSRQPVSIAPNPTSIVAKPIPAERKKIPKLTYSVLNDKQLRKKLGELGLAVHGDKQLMQKRHAEYVTIYNANCDSTRPLSDAQLHRNMEIWERTNDQDIAAKEQLKRTTEQQRLIQQRELAQKQASSSVSSTTESSDASSSASTSTSGRPFSRSSSGSNFVANQNNNAEVNVAVASASAFAHALRYANEYQELIADVRKRQEQDKLRTQEEEAKQSAKEATSSATTSSSQSSQSSRQRKASTPVERSRSQQSNASVSQTRHSQQTASQSSATSSQSSVIVEDQPNSQPSSQSSQYAPPLTPSKLRHPHRPIEQT